MNESIKTQASDSLLKNSNAWKSIIQNSMTEEKRIDLFVSGHWVLLATLHLSEGKMFVFTDGKNIEYFTQEELKYEQPDFWQDLSSEDLSILNGQLQ